MTRYKFFAALIAAPMAAFAAWKAKPVPNGELVMKVTCDTREFHAAIDALLARLEKLNIPREETDGLPAVIIEIDGKETSRFYPFP